MNEPRALQILYVEDNDSLRETIGLLMEGEGRTISAVRSAEEALIAAGTRRFDFVLTDISLPGMSGTELAERLLADAPDRRVVLCSGNAFDAAASRLGPNVRMLTKPFDIDCLDALLQEAAVSLGL